MFAEFLLNKKILIYGLGLSGNSCLQYLSKKSNVKVFDDNSAQKKTKHKKYLLSKNKILKEKFDYIILSPGIDINKCTLKFYLLKNRKKIITELDVFYLINPSNTKITITGTNGKSSTCLMLYNILKSKKLDVRLVGNIGKPPLKETGIKKKTIFIVEASSYQISYSKYFKSDYAAILNLNIDHLERHNNIEKYAKAKVKLIKDQKKNKISLIEKNSFLINKYIKNKNVSSKVIKIAYNKIGFFKKKIKNNYLLDRNNLNNIHFVFEISKIFKVSNNKIFKSLNYFKGLKFRKQTIYNKLDLEIINDSKSTSFSSTNSLLSNHKKIYWIVGGMFKKGDKFVLEKKYYKNIKAYIIGLNKNYFVNQFKNKISFEYSKNLRKAILTIKKDIKKDSENKIILFSPAALLLTNLKILNIEEIILIP